ncbi:MAG: cellulase family glycosylhydrolase, partial [Armatimonadota bacterium]
MIRLLTFILCSSVIAVANASNLPSPSVPDGLGANIHFLGEPVRVLDMLQAGGFRFVRMDISWSTVEKEKGVYDFSEHDKLIEGLSKRGMRALLILCYSNTLYETNFMSVRTEAGRQAFAQFSKAAVQRYKGKNVIWEIWNEPNIMFWRPQPSIDDYMALVKAVVPVIREADPKAVCIGPATSAVDMIYLEACFKRGLLNYIDAVSVHPYRSSIPETVTSEILALKTLIARYSPDRPNIPIISGEWGYTTVWPHTNTYSGVANKLQGEYLPRQMLTNLSLGIPLSIWYDWHDGGADPMEREFHFGTVDFEYNPKPSYINMKKMTELLSGKQFVKRVPTDLDDYLLIFSDGKRHTIAAWTIAKPHTVNPSARTRIDLTNEPQYLDVHVNDREMLAQSIFTVTCKSHGIRSGVSSKHRFAPQFTVHVSNPFAKSIRVELKPVMSEFITGSYVGATSFMLEPDEEKTVLWRGKIHRRDKTELSIEVNAVIDGIKCSQVIEFGLIDLLSLDMQMQRDGTLAVVIHNPGLSKLSAELLVKSGYTVVFSKLVDIHSDRMEIPIGTQDTGVGNGLRVTLQNQKGLIADSGEIYLLPLDVTVDNAISVVEGDL